jgi:hypothetical protein
MRSNHPAWLNWEGGVEQQEFDIGAAVSGELFRNPDNPFEAWDEDGQPCLPMTIGDESASSELHSDPLDDQPWPSWGTQQSGVAIFDQGARHPAPASTSMLDSFDWSVPDHPQTRVRIGDEIVSIDAEMGPLIFLMNRAGINTVTSCQGDERQWAYVMIADLVAALKFLRLWHRHLKPLGHPLPVLDLALRDGEWREDVGGEFPFPVSVPQDDLGFSFTAIWRLYYQDLEQLMPDLLDALRREIQGVRSE